MPQSNTHNFDVIYEISKERFLYALQNRFINDLPLGLQNMPLQVALPGAVGGATQSGSLSLLNRPNASLTFLDDHTFNLQLDFSDSTLTLVAIPAGGILGGPGLAGLGPTSAGSTTITLNLTIATQTSGNQSPVTIAIGSQPIMSRLSKLDSLAPAVPPGGTLQQMRNNIQAAALAAVTQVMQAAFPNVIDVGLPTTGPCDIRPRELKLKLLSAADNTATDALGFFLAALPSSMGAGDLTAFTNSDLAAGAQGILKISNALVLQLLCCIVPQSPQIQGLSGNAPTDDTCCKWTNQKNITIGGTLFPEVPLFQICLVVNGFELTVDVKKSGFGWHASAHFVAPVTVRQQAGSLVPTVGKPTINVSSEVEWWVWLIAALIVIVLAVIGGLAGGWVGAVVGAIVGVIIAAIFLIAMYGLAGVVSGTINAALGALSGVLQGLQILPSDLTNVFGTLDLLGDPVIDDIVLQGSVVLPDDYPTAAASADQVLNLGEIIDLDRGVVTPVFTSGEADPDADLKWNRSFVVLGGQFEQAMALRRDYSHVSVGAIRGASTPAVEFRRLFDFSNGIEALGSARVIALNKNFYSLGESDVSKLIYPDHATVVPYAAVPLSDSPDPTSLCVFGVRTTAGRYAKCGAWRDSGDRLHLRYRTYDTPLPLALFSKWQYTDGPIVGSGGGILPYTEFQVAAHGTFWPVPENLQSPITYVWLWDGREISGNGMLPDGTTSYQTGDQICELWTAMGKPLNGELCLQATDAAGIAVTACRQLSLTGTRKKYDTSLIDRLRAMEAGQIPIIIHGPGPDPGPAIGPEVSLSEQIVTALNAGMGHVR